MKYKCLTTQLKKFKLKIYKRKKLSNNFEKISRISFRESISKSHRVSFATAVEKHNQIDLLLFLKSTPPPPRYLLIIKCCSYYHDNSSRCTKIFNIKMNNVTFFKASYSRSVTSSNCLLIIISFFI